MSLPCNPQWPAFESLEECPEGDPHACGRCELIHRARRFAKENAPKDLTVWYPYNETFKEYGEPRCGVRAHSFIAYRNTLKGGHWVLHTREQYAEWYEKVGCHKDDVRFLRRRDAKP
jgi:hypothetical protein